MLRRVEQKKERRKKFFIGLFLVAVMVMSGFGIYLSGQDAYGTFFFNDLKFEVQDNVYVTKINDRQIYFYNPPSTLQIYNVTPIIPNVLKNAQVIVQTFDPESEELIVIDRIRFELSQLLDKQTANTVIKPSDIYNLPVYTCVNATFEAPVIYYNVSNTTSIEYDNNCIIINAKSLEFLKMRDLLLYHYYGVLPVEEEN
jgi:hypothetical protein